MKTRKSGLIYILFVRSTTFMCS